MGSFRARITKLYRSDFLKLVPILGLAFYIAYIPHLDYPYALHVDEWVHIAHANSLLAAGNVQYPDPFTGFGTGSITSQLEIGFHLPLTYFHQLSGLSWMDIARYFPSVVLCLTVLSVYLFARRLGFGWEAAFFSALLPTTVGVLGPAFLVPMALALFITMLLIFLVYYYRSSWTYVMVLLLGAYLMILHGTSAVLALFIIVPFLLLILREEKRHVLLVFGVGALGITISLPWTYDLFASQGASLFAPYDALVYHEIPNIIELIGVPVIVAGLVYVLVTSIAGNRKSYGLLIGCVFLLILLALYNTQRYGLVMLYLRGLIFLIVIMSILAGGGLKYIRTFNLPRLTGKTIRTGFSAVAVLAGVGLMVATLMVVIPDRLETPYYHTIDRIDYENFLWIRDNLDPSLQRVMLDPWKATAFAALTQRTVYTRTHDSAGDKEIDVYDRFNTDNVDTEFLISTGIGIIYTRIGSNAEDATVQLTNPDLVEVRPNIYIRKTE